MIFGLLKGELGRKLDATRTPTTEEWVADAHIARCLERIPAHTYFPVAAQRETINSWVRNKQWEEWTGKIGMVQYIEELCAKLQVQSLTDRRVLEDREVPLPEMRAA